MADLNDLPESLQRLISDLIDLVVDETGKLELDLEYVVAWQGAMERYLTRYHVAAMMAGQGSAVLSRAAQQALRRDVRAQLEFLDNFAVTIQKSETFQAGWLARAEMYAEAIKVPYWQGATRMLPLPAMPAEGTQCRTRCKCRWDIRPVDEQAGDFDCYWVRGASDSCQTCVVRERQWSPLQIRGGRLVI